MSMPATVVRRSLIGVLVSCALGGAVLVATATPPATAAPDPCTASGLANVVSGVAGSAGQYLVAHPDADQALTAAGTQGPQAESAVKGYFVTHLQEFADLRNIAKPLTDLKTQCGATVSPDEISSLFDAFSG